VYLTFEDLVVSIPSKAGPKVLIDHVTGYAVSGRVLALMGPSGARVCVFVSVCAPRVAAQPSPPAVCGSDTVNRTAECAMLMWARERCKQNRGRNRCWPAHMVVTALYTACAAQ
jgi:hypothetical protein